MVQWLHDILVNRAFINGTYYYIHPEYFLYAIVRFLEKATDSSIHSRFIPVLRQCVQERIGVPGDALSIAMRIVVCNYVGIRNDVDMEKLLQLQCEDGGWEMSWVYRLPSRGFMVGNRGLATAVAVKAIQGFPPASSSPKVLQAMALAKRLPPFRTHFFVLLLIAVICALTLSLSRLYQFN
jgi:hypothetical protein